METWRWHIRSVSTPLFLFPLQFTCQCCKNLTFPPQGLCTTCSVFLECSSFFIFNWRVIAPQYCVGLCHISAWTSHWYTHVPPLPGTLLPPPTAPHPSRLSGSPRFELLCHRTDSHWLSILHMVMYMFQWCSPNSSFPLLSPLCLQVWMFCFKTFHVANFFLLLRYLLIQYQPFSFSLYLSLSEKVLVSVRYFFFIFFFCFSVFCPPSVSLQ